MIQRKAFSILFVSFLVIACGTSDPISFKGVPLDQMRVIDDLKKICQESNKYKEEMRTAGEVVGGEFKASHILVKSADEANKLIIDLQKGADFARLARKYSLDRVPDGDLGWFSVDQMSKPFLTAIVKLEKGQITETPVETQYGYHIILLEDSKPIHAPTPDCSFKKGMNNKWFSYGFLSERPAWISIGVNDSLVEIEIMGSKEEMLGQVETLVAKYGKPSRAIQQVTNGFGTKFDKEIFTWTDSRGSQITVESVYGKVDEGRIIIESASTVAAKKAAEKSLIEVGKENL
jgi:hypothetical protein